MSNIKRTLWRSQLDGVEDITSRLQSVIDTGRSKIKLPEGKFRFTSTLVLHTHQRLIGSGIGRRDGSRGTYLIFAPPQESSIVAIQVGGSLERAENCRIESLRLHGPGRNEDPESDVLHGVQVGLPDTINSANHFGMRDVVIENFDVGYDNYFSDNSSIRGGFLTNCNINGRTNQNSINEVTSCGCIGAVRFGWQITGQGPGLQISTSVFGGNMIDVRVETGATLVAQSLWFDVLAEGGGPCVDMDNNAVAHFISCRRVSGESLPLFVRGQNGFLKFSGCLGSPSLSFDVMSGMQVLGEGEAGIKNGMACIAGGYPVT